VSVVHRDGPVLVLEVGGTSLRAARFDSDRRVLERRQTAPTPNHLDTAHPASQQAVLDAMRSLAALVLDGDDPASVAVAYPGPLDKAGRVLAAPTVLGSASAEPFPLQEACEEMWPGATVHTMNDLTAAGYHYVGTGLRDFAVVTVGSGIGHKVFLDGRPRIGPHGRGGEIGHLRLDYSVGAPSCECGGRGHLGALASGRGTVAGVRRRAVADPQGYAGSAIAARVPDLNRIDGPAVAAAFRERDTFTVAAVHDAARYLGQGLAAVHVDTGVESIVLVGGFAFALGEPYRQMIAAAAADACWDIGQDWDSIVRLGEDGDACGLLGCGLVASGLLSAPA
jgi:predicted NBD/HSP70 family sugar kinase